MKYEEYLAEHEYLTWRFRGVSMLPMLREGRDLFTVRRKGRERCRKYDVVLFRRGGSYVLHRVVEVREDGYVTLGDNSYSKEYDVHEEDVLGVLTGFDRAGRRWSTEDLRYRIYSRLIVALYPARRLLIGLKGALARWLKREESR